MPIVLVRDAMYYCNINSHDQSERFEFEMLAISEDKEDNKDYITRYLTELSDDSKRK